MELFPTSAIDMAPSPYGEINLSTHRASAMSSHEFRSPVHVVSGIGFARKLVGVGPLLSYLESIPNALRDRAFDASRAACLGALAGLNDASAARDAFVAFAEPRSILL